MNCRSTFALSTSSILNLFDSLFFVIPSDLIRCFGKDGHSPTGVSRSENTILREYNDPPFQYQVILNKVDCLIESSKLKPMFDIVEMQKFIYKIFAGVNQDPVPEIPPIPLIPNQNLGVVNNVQHSFQEAETQTNIEVRESKNFQV